MPLWSHDFLLNLGWNHLNFSESDSDKIQTYSSKIQNVRFMRSNINIPHALVIGILLTPPSICLSVHHTISFITIWQNLTKLTTWLPPVVRVCEIITNFIFHSTLFDLQVGSKGHCLFVILSPPKLLARICYMPSLHGKARATLFFRWFIHSSATI